MNSIKQQNIVRRMLIAIMGIGLLGSFPGHSGFVSEVQAKETLVDVSKRLTALEERLEEQVSVPVGTIMPYGGPVPIDEKARKTFKEKGWLFCNGQKLNRNDYNELYLVIGGAFGASDNDSFNIPDLRGRFVRGVDHGQKKDPDAGTRSASARGGNTGNKVGSVQEDDFKLHSHDMGNSVGAGARYYSGGGHGSPKRETGSKGGNETRPKNIYVNWIIKAKSAK